VIDACGHGTDTVGRRLSKIIRSEAKAEKASLDVALGELVEIQKLQKASVKVRYCALPPSPSKKKEDISAPIWIASFSVLFFSHYSSSLRRRPSSTPDTHAR
jgi:hypothetical protein